MLLIYDAFSLSLRRESGDDMMAICITGGLVCWGQFLLRRRLNLWRCD